LFREEPGVLKGKTGYMSPEQARGEKVDRRSDVYSLGVVFHELLTGRPLHGAADGAELLEAVRAGMVEPPSTFAREVPPELEAIVMRALSKDREERFQTARDMAAAITRALFKAAARRFARARWGDRAVRQPRAHPRASTKPRQCRGQPVFDEEQEDASAGSVAIEPEAERRADRRVARCRHAGPGQPGGGAAHRGRHAAATRARSSRPRSERGGHHSSTSATFSTDGVQARRTLPGKLARSRSEAAPPASAAARAP
jgi:hypothetical protein